MARSRGAHFRTANRDLLAAIDSDPDFAAAMGDLIPGIRDSLAGPRGGISRTSPSPLWTWHHAADEGLMQLVPRIQHEAPGDLQDLFHREMLVATQSGADELLSMSQLISRLDAIDDDLAVYVRLGDAISPEMPIALVSEEEQDSPGEMAYLLEIGHREGRHQGMEGMEGMVDPDTSQACEAVAYYASHDAFKPV